MAATKELIKRIRLTTSAASITFYNIPQDFDGLEIQMSFRSDAALTVADPYISFNGSTSNFSGRRLFGNGSSASSDSTARFVFQTSGASSTASTFGSGKLYIPNYAGSTYKSFSSEGVSENNATSAYQSINAGLWSDVSAITSVTFTLSSGNFVQYSSAALYGWKKGSDGITSVG